MTVLVAKAALLNVSVFEVGEYRYLLDAVFVAIVLLRLSFGVMSGAVLWRIVGCLRLSIVA
jgi:hypothetical protein